MADAVKFFRAAVERLLDALLTPVASVELAQTLVELETQRRRLEAVEHRLLPEVAERGLAGDYGRASTADLLVELLRVAPAEAKARVASVHVLVPNRPCPIGLGWL
ncbi:DUF222 domain-containing protein [uncultured Jatrophihabitans sp.]|uniref:DUF222 domain-containing protein n=1 Tax=uncultured Jatrophihabitans sp. TaxID=1610747 RepID=UPI0035CBE7BF